MIERMKGGEPGPLVTEGRVDELRSSPATGAARFRGLAIERIAGLEVPVAESVVSRLLGLSHLDRDRAGAGLLIPRCRSVHTFGMRFPISVFFLGEDDRLMMSRLAVPPRRIVRCPRARHVLELVPFDGIVGGDW